MIVRYLLGLLISIGSGLLYAWFRSDVFDDLISRGIRKRDIRQKMKGIRQYWFYQELEAAYGLGLYGKLMRLYVPVWGIITVFHILFGWIAALSAVDIGLMNVMSLFLSVMILYTRIRLNCRIVGTPFVLLAWKKIMNRKGAYMRTDYYFTALDLTLAAFPLACIWVSQQL